MSASTSRRRSGGELDAIIWFLPLAGVAGGVFVGIPGVGLYVGLLIASLTIRLVGTNNPVHEATIGALTGKIGHPFAPAVRTGPDGKWWPPSRLSTWWSILLSSMLAAVPLFLHAVVHLRLPHHLIEPSLALASFVGYFCSIQAIAAAKRKDKPPVVIERTLIREKSASIVSAAIVGASLGIIAFLAISHASTVRAFATTSHRATFTGPDAYAGLGLRGATAVSATIALVLAFAMASAAYKAAWRAPHEAREQKLSEWEAAWLKAVGNMAPPLFISEAKVPEEAPEVCSALFQVPPGGTIEAYASKADKLASALGAEAVSITPDVARDQAGNPMHGASSTTVFRVSYPLVPIGPNAHLSREFTSKTPLYEYVVSSTLRRIFMELKLGQPMLWAFTILTTPDSPGRLVETMWILAPGTTFDQVAKASNALMEKSGARWLRVGRRTTLDPDGELAPGTFVSVLFGDPPATARFIDGKVFKASDHQRFIDMIDWDARFRSVGLASSTAGPTLVDSEDVEGELRALSGEDVSLRVWTFAYPAGLSAKDVESAMPALKSSPGLAFVAFRHSDDPNKFELLTADVDPLALAYPFLKAAPKILRRPVPGKPRLQWTVGVGPDGNPVTFKFGTDDPHLLVAGMTGSGKAQPLTSRLPVPISERFPTGWATIADVTIGDRVFGADGSAIAVTGLSPIELKPVYEVEFDDGQVVECSPGHLWKVSSASSRRARTPKLVVRRAARHQSLAGRAGKLFALAASIGADTVAPLRDIAALAGVDVTTLHRVLPRRLSVLAEVPTKRRASEYSTDGFLRWARCVTEARGSLVLCGNRLDFTVIESLAAARRWLTLRQLAAALFGRATSRSERDLVKQMLRRSAAARRPSTTTRTMRVYPVGEALVLVAESIADRAGRSDSGRSVAPLETVVTAEEMAATLSDAGHNARRNWAVALSEPIGGQDAPLPVPPYVLGVWLGDGNSREAQITSADPEIITHIEQAGYRLRRVENTGSAASSYFFDGLLADLRHAGFGSRLRVPAAKCIPPEYLRASVRQRLELLQGLMDTDGTVGVDGSCELTLCSELLSRHALELIRSIGIKASMTARPAEITEADPDRVGEKRCRITGTRWRITFTTTKSVFRLPRKVERLPVSTRKTQDWLYVTDIRKKAPAPMRCLVVDHPEHLYLTEHFVPTHNSMMLISMLLQLATANEPNDVQFRIVDPKTALVPFRDLAHVTHFVMNQPGRDRYEDFLELLRSTVREMETRYGRLNELGVEDLDQARQIRQMMDVPYVVTVVEEASLMLICPDKQLERAIVEEVGKIANLGRGAGVYIVLATQYPSNHSVPNHLREQFSRIGFKVQDWRASNIIINESGLEDLVLAGQGKMRCGGEFVPFRGFFLHPGDGPADLDKAGDDELNGVVRQSGRSSDRSLVLSHLPKASTERTVTGKGSWEPFVVAPVPEGIWGEDDQLSGVDPTHDS